MRMMMLSVRLLLMNSTHTHTRGQGRDTFPRYNLIRLMKFMEREGEYTKHVPSLILLTNHTQA